MLQTIQLPTRIAHLYSGLADMDGNDFTLEIKCITTIKSTMNNCEQLLILPNVFVFLNYGLKSRKHVQARLIALV